MPFADGVEVVGVDGDDTLWRCQDAFDAAEVEVARLLAPYAPVTDVMDALATTERTNLGTYGFGVKAWTLNVLETCERLGAVGLAPQVLALGRTHRVVLVTKGDLVDQQRKLAASGLAGCFDHVQIVSDKTVEQYGELVAFLGVAPEGFLMVGNSEHSDVRPVLRLGGWAVHVPYRTEWVLERVDEPVEHERLVRVSSLSQVPELLTAS